jgi:tetratricopeptide (TPR) repeat protein
MASPSDNLRRLMGRPAAMLILTMLVWIMSTVDIRATDTCLSASGEKAVAACRRELLQDPRNLDIRFALSDAFMALNRYEDAVAVLREGFEHAPGDDRIKKKLMLAESYLEEQRWIEKQQRRNEDAVRDKKQSAQIRLSLIRCKKLTGNAAMSACNDGLDMVPEVPGVTH